MNNCILYVRVSSKEQKEEGFSIPAQKKLLWEFVKKQGFKVVKEFEDDETAKTAGRTGFNEMVEYLNSHKDVNTILVEKTDRLYRNFKDYVMIDDLDVTVFLVKENEIIGKDANSHQKFIHGIKVLMAKNYVDNLSEEVKKGLLQKAEEGIPPSSMPPLGYKMGLLDGKPAPIVDELNRDLVIQMFELYSTGIYSLQSLIDKLYVDELVIPANFPKSSKLKRITKSSVQRILRNPMYYGDFLWKDILYTGKHEPIVSRNLWDKVQAVLNRFENKEMQSKYGAKLFVFRGLIRCAECGRTVTADKKVKKSGREYIYYRCTHYKTNCSQQPVNEDKLHEQIMSKLSGLHVPQPTIDYIKAGLKESLEMKKGTVDRTRDGLEEKRQLLLSRIDKLYEDKIDETISKDFYVRKNKEYESDLKKVENKIAKYRKADRDYYATGSGILELSKRAKLLYENANNEERQKLLAFLLSNSTLQDGNLHIQYKKPFDRVFARATCSDWRGGRDSNPRPSA